MSFKRIFFLIPNIFFWIFLIFEISTHVKYFRFFLKRKNESSKDYGVVHTDFCTCTEGGEVVRTRPPVSGKNLNARYYGAEMLYSRARMP